MVQNEALIFFYLTNEKYSPMNYFCHLVVVCISMPQGTQIEQSSKRKINLDHKGRRTASQLIKSVQELLPVIVIKLTRSQCSPIPLSIISYEAPIRQKSTFPRIIRVRYSDTSDTRRYTYPSRTRFFRFKKNKINSDTRRGRRRYVGDTGGAPTPNKTLTPLLCRPSLY
jgi:hypothetical protein